MKKVALIQTARRSLKETIDCILNGLSEDELASPVEMVGILSLPCDHDQLPQYNQYINTRLDTMTILGSLDFTKHLILMELAPAAELVGDDE